MRSIYKTIETAPTEGCRLPYDGARRLIAAIILRAVEQSQAGDAEAGDWLATVGCDWCERFLHFEVAPGAWAHVDLATARRRLSMDPAEVAARDERLRKNRRLSGRRTYAREKQARGLAA